MNANLLLALQKRSTDFQKATSKPQAQSDLNPVKLDPRGVRMLQLFSGGAIAITAHGL